MKLPANTSLAVTVEFVNASGLPVDVDGTVSWESSDPALATVVADATDSHMAMITAGPSAGECEVFATGDADLGAGVTEVEASMALTIIAKGEAIGGEISPVKPGHGLPGQPGHPDNALPSPPVRPDHTLPPLRRPVDPSYGQGITGRPDQGLPGSQPGVDNALPGGAPPLPGQGLPETPEPKS
jgi:hypothetical protein